MNNIQKTVSGTETADNLLFFGFVVFHEMLDLNFFLGDIQRRIDAYNTLL